VYQGLCRFCAGGAGSCVFVGYAGDTRYGGEAGVHTHNPAIRGAGALAGGVRAVKARKLLAVALSDGDRCIGVDEGQFFPDLREALLRWEGEGRHVYVAALDGDYKREAFGPVAAALPLATHLTKLEAVCASCSPRRGRPVPAHYSRRKTPSTEVELIGGAEEYSAACPACYLGGGAS
jgi:thymidine kinase